MIDMHDFKKISLDNSALQYIEQALGWLTLGEYVKGTLKANNWDISTIMPKNSTDDMIYAFSTGGILPIKKSWIREDGARIEEVQNMDDFIIHIVDTYLQENKERICVIQDVNAIPSDPWIMNADREGFLVHKSEVYYCKNNMTNKDTTTFIRNRSNYKFSAILCEYPLLLSKEPTKVETEDLFSMAQQTDIIIVGAYDDEGFIVCKRGIPEK